MPAICTFGFVGCFDGETIFMNKNEVQSNSELEENKPNLHFEHYKIQMIAFMQEKWMNKKHLADSVEVYSISYS